MVHLKVASENDQEAISKLTFIVHFLFNGGIIRSRSESFVFLNPLRPSALTILWGRT
jgi:hypothetical protein